MVDVIAIISMLIILFVVVVAIGATSIIVVVIVYIIPISDATFESPLIIYLSPHPFPSTSPTTTSSPSPTITSTLFTPPSHPSSPSSFHIADPPSLSTSSSITTMLLSSVRVNWFSISCVGSIFVIVISCLLISVVIIVWLKSRVVVKSIVSYSTLFIFHIPTIPPSTNTFSNSKQSSPTTKL